MAETVVLTGVQCPVEPKNGCHRCESSCSKWAQDAGTADRASQRMSRPMSVEEKVPLQVFTYFYVLRLEKKKGKFHRHRHTDKSVNEKQTHGVPSEREMLTQQLVLTSCYDKNGPCQCQLQCLSFHIQVSSPNTMQR